MEHINYVERAKKLIGSAVRTTALLVVPLACSVSESDASTILPSTFQQCNTSGAGGFGQCSGGASPLLNGATGDQGVSLYTTQTAIFETSQTGALFSHLILSAEGSVFPVLDSGTVIPVAFDFTLAGAPVTSWTLRFGMRNNVNNFDQIGDLEFNSTGAGGGRFVGTGEIVTRGTSQENIVLYAILFVNWTNAGSDVLTIDVPSATSFDFLPTADTAVPEPASLGLVASAVAVFGLLARRKK